MCASPPWKETKCTHKQNREIGDDAWNMLKALQDIVRDEPFQINVEPALSAYRQASSLGKWVSEEENKTKLEEFILAELKKCIPDNSTETSTALHSIKVDAWRKYHHLCYS